MFLLSYDGLYDIYVHTCYYGLHDIYVHTCYDGLYVIYITYHDYQRNIVKRYL